MPIHDWTRVTAGEFHHFHQTWAAAISAAFNRGVLPPGYQAWVERKAVGWEPDVLALTSSYGTPDADGGTATAVAMSKTRIVVHESDADDYAARANRVAVRRKGGELVAVVEIVSPGNKDSRNALTAFLRKTTELIDRGIHLLVVDLFPPNPRAPDGIHKPIWDEFRELPFDLPPDEPCVLASYQATRPRAAYVETIGVGDPLPEMPLFLGPELHVLTPLEATYQRAWDESPGDLREALASPAP
ncbi:MAG: DUF4058 family protein [Fimbriiglobus sp.]